MNQLHRCSIAHDVGRAQSRVTIEQNLAGVPQRGDIDARTYAHTECDVVRRTVGGAPLQEPQRRLAVGQRSAGGVRTYSLL